MPVVRFIGSTVCVMALVFVLIVLVVGNQYDRPSSSFIFYVLDIILAVVAWPFVAVSFFIFHGYYSGVFFVSAWIATGIFWAAVIELFIRWRKRRKRPNTALEPTVTAPSVSDKP